VGQVQDTLVVGVGVNGRHQTVDDPEALVKDFGQRCQAVGGAGSVGYDMVSVRPVHILVDAHDDGDILALGRGVDNHLFGAGPQVAGRGFPVGKAAGGFHHDVYFAPGPGNPARIRPGQDGHLPPEGGKAAFPGGHVPGQRAVHRIVLEEVGQRLGRGQVVDGNNRDDVAWPYGPEEMAADPAEPVNTDFYGQAITSPLKIGFPRVYFQLFYCKVSLDDNIAEIVFPDLALPPLTPKTP
jgi:hypothetical protein